MASEDHLSEQKAQRRIWGYLQHLIGEYSNLGDSDLLQKANTASVVTPSIKPQDVAKGWTSQPMVFLRIIHFEPPQEFDYELEVVGTIPIELHGTLFRNGPGLLEVYGTPLVHPIDGDGMICSIKFRNGRAHFRSKYVGTKGYVMEKEAKKSLFHGMMGTVPPKDWSETFNNIIKPSSKRWKNPSNTNVYYWGGKLLACWESGLPHLLNPATLETIRKDDLGGVLSKARCLAAHFRYDTRNNRLVNFSLQLNKGFGTMFIYEFDQDFKIVTQQEHKLEQYYYCHDFMITEHYYVLHHSPFVSFTSANSAKIVTGLAAPGQLMQYYPGVPSRMIVIPRDPNSKSIQYFDTEPCQIFHHLNAWEDGNNIRFSSICLGKKFNMEFENKSWLSNGSVAPGEVFNYNIDLQNKTIQREKADSSSCEFPSIHPHLHGKEWRYGYLMAADSPHPYVPFMEIIKFDRLGQKRQVWSARSEFGILGEPVFVPRPNYTEEDDGWVISQLYNCKSHRSEYVILDAKDLSAGPLARVLLAHHTPYGFHGTFWPEIFE